MIHWGIRKQRSRKLTQGLKKNPAWTGIQAAYSNTLNHHCLDDSPFAVTLNTPISMLPDSYPGKHLSLDSSKFPTVLAPCSKNFYYLFKCIIHTSSHTSNSLQGISQSQSVMLVENMVSFVAIIFNGSFECFSKHIGVRKFFAGILER
jgi:hypothetical protein